MCEEGTLMSMQATHFHSIIAGRNNIYNFKYFFAMLAVVHGNEGLRHVEHDKTEKLVLYIHSVTYIYMHLTIYISSFKYTLKIFIYVYISISVRDKQRTARTV